MSNNTIVTKENWRTSSRPLKNKVVADDINQLSGWQNSPMNDLGIFSAAITLDTQGSYTDRTLTGNETWNFSGIVAGIVQYQKITTDGTHTITVGTNGRILSGTLGQLDAGTYDILFGSFNTSEVLISIPGTATTITTLTTPTLTLVAQDGAVGYTISNEDAAATDGVFTYDTNSDFSTEIPVPGYVFATKTGTISSLTNGVPYYARIKNTASGYTDSAYGSDSATPTAGIIQLTALTLGTAVAGDSQVTVPFTNPNSNNESSNQLYYKLTTEPTVWTTGVTAVTGATTFPAQTGLTNGLGYDFKAVAEGDGVIYSDSADSNEVSATPSVTYTAEYQAVYDQMINKPSSADATKQEAVVSALVSNGIWSKLDYFSLWGIHSNAGDEVLINWIDPTSGLSSYSGTPRFTQYQGIDINGGGNYLYTNIQPDGLSNYKSQDACIGFNAFTDKGTPDVDNTNAAGARTPASTPYTYLEDDCFKLSMNKTFATSDSGILGPFNTTINMCLNATTLRAYTAGASVYSKAQTGSTLPGESIAFLTAKGGTGSTEQILFAGWFGADLDDTENASLHTALNNYKSSL